MRKLIVFNFTTLNGYFTDQHEGIDWHPHGNEQSDFAAENLQTGNTLLFGRITYEMMAGYWPTPAALDHDPQVAAGMNRVEKIVFSRTLKKPVWNNTQVITKDMIGEVKKLKSLPGKDLTLLGSGSISAQLASHGLIDEYQIMIDPVAIAKGRSLFENVKHPIALKLKAVRQFKSGAVLLTYVPSKN